MHVDALLLFCVDSHDRYAPSSTITLVQCKFGCREASFMGAGRIFRLLRRCVRSLARAVRRPRSCDSVHHYALMPLRLSQLSCETAASQLRAASSQILRLQSHICYLGQPCRGWWCVLCCITAVARSGLSRRFTRNAGCPCFGLLFSLAAPLTYASAPPLPQW